MSDGNIHEIKGQEEDEQVGRPNWEAREREGAEEDLDDWNPNPTPSAANAVIDQPAENASAQGEEAPRPQTEEGRGLDMSRFDMVDEDDQDGDANRDEDGKQELPESAEEDRAQDDRDESAGDEDLSEDAGDSSVSAETETAEAPAPIVIADLPEDWHVAPRQAVLRWSEKAPRHAGSEAFKTGLVLPLLSALGYDVFDPDSIAPLEDETGRLDGYLANSANGTVVVLLEDADTPDDHRDEVTMRTRRDRLVIGVRIEHEDADSKWQPVFEMDLSAEAPVLGLRHIHHDAFDKHAVIAMAEQVQGQQEDIQEAVRTVISAPGEGFVEDVRRFLAQQGHENPVMLEERVSLAVSRMLSGPTEEEEVEEEAGGRRKLTPAETRAVEIIRELCGPEIPAEDIVPRPGQAYTAVLHKDNNRRTIARLHFSAASVKYIGLFVDGDEVKERIEKVEDIENHRDVIRARAVELDPDAFPTPDED